MAQIQNSCGRNTINSFSRNEIWSVNRNGPEIPTVVLYFNLCNLLIQIIRQQSKLCFISSNLEISNSIIKFFYWPKKIKYLGHTIKKKDLLFSSFIKQCLPFHIKI